MWSGVFKILGFVVFIFALVSLYSGHHKHIQNVYAGKSLPVTYHSIPKSSLYCDGVLIGTGIIKYEGRVYGNKSVANSNGIWYIGDKVFKQKDGSVCYKENI